MKEITPKLLERYYKNECTEEERKDVKEWLEGKKGETPNEEAYLKAVWEKVKVNTFQKHKRHVSNQT